MASSSNNQDLVTQAKAAHTAWETKILSESNSPNATYLLDCVKQVFSRRVHDDEDPETINEIMAVTVFPLKTKMQEYEQSSNIIALIKTFITASDQTNRLTPKKKLAIIQGSEHQHNLARQIGEERDRVWQAIKHHPYYGNMYASIKPDDTTAAEFLETLKKDVWSFFNRRYTFIILRAMDPTLAPATDRDYAPNFLLEDSEHFNYTKQLLDECAEERRKIRKKRLGLVYWTREEYNERKINELCP